MTEFALVALVLLLFRKKQTTPAKPLTYMDGLASRTISLGVTRPGKRLALPGVGTIRYGISGGHVAIVAGGGGGGGRYGGGGKEHVAP